MNYLDRFEITSAVSERCRRARDRQTGLNVLIHVLSRERDYSMLLKKSALLVSKGAQDGIEFAVTPDRAELLDIQAWAARQPVAESNEFTRVMKAPVPAAPEPPPPPPVLQSPPPVVQAAEPPNEFDQLFGSAPQPAAQEAGEFTNLFRAPVAAAPAPAGPPQTAAKPVAVTPEEKTGPGEFTQMFQAGKAASAPAPPAFNYNGPTQEVLAKTPTAPQPSPVPQPAPVTAAPPAQPPGEFTRMFRPEAAHQELPPQAAPKAPAAPPPDPNATRVFQPSAPAIDTPKSAANVAPSQPGEFTSMFRPPTTAPVSSPPPPLPKEPARGEFTEMFRQPPPTAPPPPPRPQTQEPGSFTAMFQAPAKPHTPAPQLPTEPGFSPPRQKENTDFDRFFDAPYASNQPAMESKLHDDSPRFQDAPPPRDAGDFTRLFGGKNAAPAAGPMGATGAFSAPVAPQAPVQQAPSGPSEYTALFRRQESAQASAQAAPATPSAPAAQPAKPQMSMLIIVLLAVAALLIVGICVVLVMNRGH